MAQRTSSESHADVRVFLIVHQAFRTVTNRLIEATEKLEPSALQPVIGSRWAFCEGVLHVHHHTEDANVFPALLEVRPDLEPLVKNLETDHRRLIPAIDDVSAAVAAFEQEPDAAHQKLMHDAMVVVRDAFFPHLDAEDSQIIPAIAESMDPKVWERLDKNAMKAIPRQYLPTAVGGIDELIRAMPKEEWPPPPPLPIRLMLALSWRKKWAAWMQPLLV